MIVLDASAAIEIVRGTKQGDRYLHLIYSGERVISVDLFHAEIAHVFSRYARAGICSNGEAIKLANKASSLVDTYYAMDSIITEALSEGVRLGHSPYDMLYFVLARRTGSTLFTRDDRLAKLCVQHGVNCARELNASNEKDLTTRIETIQGRYAPASK